MAEQLQTPAVTPTAALEPVVQPGQQTPPQAATVDIDQITTQAATKATEAAEKKMEAVFKSMLSQSGIDSATINKMTEEWKSKQVTPEQEIQQRDVTIGELQLQLESERQEKIALSKGIPLGSDDEETKEKVNACMALAKSYVSETVTFEAAIDKALTIISFEQKQEKPPAMWAGAGKAPIKPSGGDPFEAVLGKYDRKKE